jgi:hypothetical protein
MGCCADTATWAGEVERGDAYLFQVLIGQVTENREIDVVLSKALRVLGHAERFEPVRNLLHCGSP